MNPIYEYIVGTVIVIMLAGWTYVSMTSSTLVAVNLLDDERINVVAREVFNKLLLTPGDPVDWNRANVKSLGLAEIGGEGFVLDKDKVLCLKNGSISINDARRLLGLERVYDFSIRVSPALNVRITSISYDLGNQVHTFNVVVNDLSGRPFSTAIVKGYYVNDTSSWKTGDAIERDSTLTDVDGRATLVFNYSNPNDVTLLITVKLSNIASVARCYVQSYSDVSCSLLVPPKPLTVQGDYVVEGQPPIYSFTFPSPEPQGGLKTVSLSQFISIEGYTYEVRFRFWRVSQ